MRLIPLALVLPACALFAPLREGPYTLTLVALVEDSCGYTEEEMGIGEVSQVDLYWDGDVMVISDGQGYGSYLWDGQSFSAEAYEEVPVDDTCTLTINSTWSGEVLSRESFGLIDGMILDDAGDCSAWDVSNLPCLTALAWEGRYSGP